MSCSLIHEKDPRVPIQRTCKKKSLLLASGERAPHVPDQAVVAHRHCNDLCMDSSQFGASKHSLLFKLLVEETDVVGNRARQQLILLHDCCNLLSESAHAYRRERQTIDQDFS